MKLKRTSYPLFASIAALVISTHMSQGADIVWGGANPGAWNTAANWTGGVVAAGANNGVVNTGTATIDAAAAAITGEVWAGNTGGQTGTISMTSTGSITVSSWFAIGRNGIGIYNQTGGTFTAAGNANTHITFGSFGGGNGTANISGGTLTTGTGNIWVGEAGSGILNLSGGTVSATGAASVMVIANGAGSGTVNLNGGTLSIRSITKNGAGAGTLNFNGGTLQSRVASATFIANLTNAFVKAGNAVFDTNGFDVTVPQNLLTDTVSTGGGLTKGGTGVLTLSGSNTYTGNGTINAGALVGVTTASLPNWNVAGKYSVAANAALGARIGTGGTSLTDFATLIGAQTYAANSMVAFDTAIAALSYDVSSFHTATTAGAAIGIYKAGANALTLTGTGTFTGGAHLRAGTLSLGSAGALATTGTISFGGGTLQFSASNTTDYSNRFATTNGQGFRIDTNGQNVSFATNLTSAGGTLNKSGLGTLTLGGAGSSVQNIFINKGTVAVGAGAQLTSTAFSSFGQNASDRSILNISGGGKVVVNGDYNVSDNAGTTLATVGGGIVNLSGAGSTSSGAQFFVGKGSSAANSFAYGAFNQSGGTFTSTNNSQIGAYGVGAYNLSGGTWNHTGGYISIGRQTGSFGLVDINGGTVNDSAAATRTIVGELGYGVMNVRNGGLLNNTTTGNTSGGNLTTALAALTVGNTAGTTGIVNLLGGGTINTTSVGSLGAGVTSHFNFNGGTLKNTGATTTFMQNLTVANVFSGGAFIDTTAGNATIPQALVAPSGSGVASITATGSGFNAAPVVQFTGGGGTGATAIATIDGSGNLTGVTITNPGINYTSAPTVTLTDAFGVQVSGTTTISANTSGDLTKQGNNILTLTAANTYTGTTTISAGTLQLGDGTTGKDGTIASSSLVNNAALIYNRFGSVTYGGAISGSGTVTKQGAGTQVLTGASSYTGATTVSTGILTLDHSGANLGGLGNTATSVAGAASLFVKGNSAIGNAAGGTLSITGAATPAAAGLLNMQDLSVNSLGIGGNLTVGSGGNGGVINFDIGSSTGSNDTVNVGGAAALSGTTTVNINALGTIAAGTSNYTLISATGGGISASSFALGTKPAGFNQYALSSPTANALVLTITANAFTTGAQYWTGLASATGSPSDATNSWGYGSALSTPKSNWSSDAAGTVDTLQVPGANSDVIFTATNAIPSSGNTLTTQLDGSFNIRGITFNPAAATTITSTVINTNSNTLTLGVGGLTQASTSNAATTISGTGSVIVNGAQNWANNHATLPLTISSGIVAQSGVTALTLNGTGAGGVVLGGVIGNGVGTLGLVFNQAGVTQVNASNTFTGGVAINSGTVKLGIAGAFNATTPAALAFGAGSTGTLQLNGINHTLGSLNTNATTGTPAIENANVANATLTVSNNTAAASDSYAGALQDGTGGGKLLLFKGGSTTSNLTLSGNSTFTGNVTVSRGSITVTNSNALGVGPKTLEVSDGTAGNVSLHLNSQGGPDISLPANFTMNASWASGVLFNDGGNNTMAGQINVVAGGGAAVVVSNSGSLTLSGPITTATTARELGLSGTATGSVTGNITNGTGGMALTKSGAGTWSLSGANAFSGIFTVSAGTLNITGGTNAVTARILATGGTTTISGGSLSETNAANTPVGIADGANLTAIMTVGGTGTLDAGLSEIYIGNGAATANGTLNLNAGGTINTSNWIGIGRAGGTGVLNVTGGTLNKTGTNATHITLTGIGGTGTINQSGGTINSLASDIYVTENNTGTYNISGGAGNFLGINLSYNGGAGTVNLNGGTITTGSIFKSNAAGTGTFNFNGGTLKPTATNTNFFNAGTSTARVRDGGAHINTNGFDITFNPPLLHSALGGDAAIDGGLVKDGAGSLILNPATASTYTGDTVVNQGTLDLRVATCLPDSTALKLATGTTLALTNFDEETVDKFYINGALQQAGVWGGPDAINPVDFVSSMITGTGTLRVTNGATGTPLDDFLTLHALPAGSYGVDSDNDGYNNLAEFILGGIPATGEAGSNTNQLAPTVNKSGANHVFVFRRNPAAMTQPNLTIKYMYGTDLTGWAQATGGMIVVTPGFYDSGTIDKVEVTVPDPVGGKNFMRMDALYNP